MNVIGTSINCSRICSYCSPGIIINRLTYNFIRAVTRFVHSFIGALSPRSDSKVCPLRKILNATTSKRGFIGWSIRTFIKASCGHHAGSATKKKNKPKAQKRFFHNRPLNNTLLSKAFAHSIKAPAINKSPSAPNKISDHTPNRWKIASIKTIHAIIAKKHPQPFIREEFYNEKTHLLNTSGSIFSENRNKLRTMHENGVQ